MTKEAFDHILANKEVTELVTKSTISYCVNNVCTSCPLAVNPKLEVRGFKSGCASSLFNLSLMSEREAEEAKALISIIMP